MMMYRKSVHGINFLHASLCKALFLFMLHVSMSNEALEQTAKLDTKIDEKISSKKQDAVNNSKPAVEQLDAQKPHATEDIAADVAKGEALNPAKAKRSNSNISSNSGAKQKIQINLEHTQAYSKQLSGNFFQLPHLLYDKVLYVLNGKKLIIIDYNKGTEDELTFDTELTFVIASQDNISKNPRAENTRTDNKRAENARIIIGSVDARIYVLSPNLDTFETNTVSTDSKKGADFNAKDATKGSPKNSNTIEDVALPKPIMCAHQNCLLSHEFDLYSLQDLYKKEKTQLGWTAFGVGRQRVVKADLYKFDDLVYASIKPDTVGVYDARSGVLIYEYVCPYAGFLEMKKVDDKLFIVSENYILVLDVMSGKKIFSVRFRDLLGCFVSVNHKRIFVYDAKNVYEVTQKPLAKDVFRLKWSMIQENNQESAKNNAKDNKIIKIVAGLEEIYVYGSEKNYVLKMHKDDNKDDKEGGKALFNVVSEFGTRECWIEDTSAAVAVETSDSSMTKNFKLKMDSNGNEIFVSVQE